MPEDFFKGEEYAEIEIKTRIYFSSLRRYGASFFPKDVFPQETKGFDTYIELQSDFGEETADIDVVLVPLTKDGNSFRHGDKDRELSLRFSLGAYLKKDIKQIFEKLVSNL